MAKANTTQTEAVATGPVVDHDKLIAQIAARSAEEYARGSDAAESGALVKAYLDETGLNSQAFAWAKSIVKKLPKKDGQQKAMDVIRSLNAVLPMLENHIMGQGTGEMQLTPDDGAEASDEIEADADDFEAATADLGGDDAEEVDAYDPDADDGPGDDTVVPMPKKAGKK